jgi:uncharacterized protein (DUF362 family)
MYKHSRREFLAGSAAGLLTLHSGFLSASQDKPLDMTIARWGGDQDLSNEKIDQAAGKMAEKAIEALGGIKRFVKNGDKVWIKPNIGWDRTPETAANTNPEIVATLVRLCQDAGAAVVKVGDNPVDVAKKTYVSSGIAAAAQAAGAKVVFLDRSRFRKTAIQGDRVQNIPIHPEILDADVLINVPIVKHHRLSTLTLCMKNFMGIIETRQVFHQDIPACLVDITRFIRPRVRLSLLDGVRILVNNGPKGGNLADVQVKMTLAAGIDQVALDAWGAELIGKKPANIPSIARGAKAGLGTMDYRSLALREITVS